MYELIYNLTIMFFKSLKGNLMYEFLISKFNGKRGPKRKLSLEQIVAGNVPAKMGAFFDDEAFFASLVREMSEKRAKKP